MQDGRERVEGQEDHCNSREEVALSDKAEEEREGEGAGHIHLSSELPAPGKCLDEAGAENETILSKR